MKKIIIIMMMFLVLIMSCFYVNATSNTEDDEFGNMVFYMTNFYSAISYGGVNNATSCYPFSVRESGYLSEIAIGQVITVTADFRLWITDDNPSPYYKNYVNLYWDGTGVFKMSDQAYPQWEKWLNVLDLYYLCIEVIGSSDTNTINQGYSNFMNYDETVFNISMNNLYPTSLSDYLVEDAFGNAPLIRYSYVSDTLQTGSHSTYFLAEMVICTKPTVQGITNKCYGKNGKGDGLNILSGQKDFSHTGMTFKYQEKTGYADSMTFYVAPYVGYLAGSKFLFNISKTDKYGNIESVLFENNSIVVTNSLIYTTQSNYTNLTITFPTPIELIEDEWYTFKLASWSSKLYMANNQISSGMYNRFNTYSDFVYAGWLGNEAYYFTYSYASSLQTTDYKKDLVFKLHFTTDIQLPDPTEAGGDCDTTCTTWNSPYMLKEDFDGSLDDCDWATSLDYCWNGSISLNTADNFYTAFKYMDLLEDSDSRYFTVKFDLLQEDIDSGGGITLSIYDLNYNRFLYIAIMDNDTLAVNYEGEWLQAVTGLSNTISQEYMLIFDFVNDEYDIYINGSLVSPDATTSIEFWNVESAYGFRVSSQLSEYTFENLEVYSSDDVGVPVVVEIGGDADTDVTPIEEDKVCGCFKNIQPECVVDGGCDTGVCTVSGTCSMFDYTWCDDHSMVHGSKCVMGCVLSCVLNETKDLIIENFLLFLVLLVIVMFIAYFVYILWSK